MVGADSVLKRLLDLQAAHAKAALEKPAGKKSFDYGMAAGTYRGLSLAIQEVESQIEAEDAENLALEDKN